MPDRFRRLFEGPDEIEQFPDRFGRVGAGATEIRDPTHDPVGQKLFQDFRDAWTEGRALSELFGTKDTLEIKAGVGEGRQNRRPDVAKVETFMNALGEHDPNPTDGPTGFLNSRLEEDLQRFQAKSGLTVDGIVDPGGETLRQIQDELPRALGSDALRPQRSRPEATGSLLGAPADDPLAGIELPEGPGESANLIPTQSTKGLPGRGRKPPPTHRQAERESTQRFNEELDSIEDRMRQIEEDGIRKGFKLAPRALRHFREGSGTTLHVKRDWLRHRGSRSGCRDTQSEALRELADWQTIALAKISSRKDHRRLVEIEGRREPR